MLAYRFLGLHLEHFYNDTAWVTSRARVCVCVCGGVWVFGVGVWGCGIGLVGSDENGCG